MEFIENKGQWDNRVTYRSNFESGSFFLEKNGFTVLTHLPGDLQKISAQLHGHGLDNKGNEKIGTDVSGPVTLHSFAYKVSFFGSNKNSQILPEKDLPTYNNYFIGNDPSKWAAACKLYQAVVYKDVYKNIDVRYYPSNGRMKYDFIVRSGGNPNAIGMRYDGPTGLQLKDKKLIIHTTVGDITELDPYTYQPGEKEPQPVECKYVLKDNVVSFDVKNYDATKTLIIDPSIVFVSFTGSTADNWGYTATPGPDGSFFAGGISFGTGYPVSPGAFDVTFNGGVSQANLTNGYDIALFKFSANGSNRLYATYIGGSRNEQPHSMIVDAQGNLVIAGASDSPDYPQKGLSGFADNGDNYDIIVTKFNATGTAIIGSAKIGGTNDDGINIKPKYSDKLYTESLRRNYGDDARSEVILDAANNIILASCTQSANFPVRNSAIQTVKNAGGKYKQDGVILKLSPNVNTLLFSTFFGGSDDDACFVAAINPTDGNIYIGGSTGSSTLPGNTAGVLAPASNGGIDGFVTIISPDGAAVVKTTFIGTGAVDMLFGLKFDKFGFPYIMGTTTSSSWKVINANYADGGAKQFIAKLKPDLSAYVYSTVFGTTNSVDPNISPIAFLVDRCQNVYVSGWGGGINKEYNPMGSTANLPETNPLAGIPPADGQDFYFFVLERDAQSRLFASHFGQSGGLGDHVDGGTSRFDENGVIYQAVCANCNREGSFPTTGGVWSVTNNSPSCNEAAVKIEMNFSGVGAKLQASINGDINDTSACTGNTIVFKDILNKGKTFIFDFGDGSPRQTVAAPANTVSHIYNTVGVFRVMLIAEDLNTCNIRDTTYKNVRIGDNRAVLSFNAAKNPPCESLSYNFTNTTTVSVPNFTSNNFYWDYGDGSPIDTINGFAPNPATHTYAKIGTYTVKLFVQGDNFCNAPDSISQVIRVNPIVKAIFTTPAIGCAPYTAIFKNQSLAGSSFQWQFENGIIFSTLSDPTYLFTTPGVFRVRLIANDPSTCNKTDTSAFFTITVLPKPMAGATWGPNPPIENVPVSFTNLSSPDAVRFKWFFGDGDSSTVTNPVHEYNATGTYKALLIAYNKLDCNDTFRLAVRVVILPLLDVPNAFTPGKNGENGVVKVRGFGITKLNWNIYNRWGQLMFSSNSKLIGWDGKYKGKLQPMDVYTYSLDAELATGEKIRKTGDITLLR